MPEVKLQHNDVIDLYEDRSSHLIIEFYYYIWCQGEHENAKIQADYSLRLAGLILHKC